MALADQDIDYNPSPTCYEFQSDSHSFVKGIKGPIGSGKSVACAVELLWRGLWQEPGPDGVRRTRWAVVRNTYPELKTTTVKTFEEWMPAGACNITYSAPIIAKVRFNGPPHDKFPQGTRMEMEVIFLSMDKDEDVKKLKSLELTGAWVNEASEIPKSVIDMLGGRVARYPAKRVGGPTWSGIIMDTNPPADDSWWYNWAEVEKPEGYSFYTQPGALIQIPVAGKKDVYRYEANPLAENVEHQPLGYTYWTRQIAGKDLEWIKVFILGQYGSIFTGKPVYQGVYNDNSHVSHKSLKVYRGLPIYLGWDFGLTPACIIGQQTPRGRLNVLREFICERGGIRQFAEDVVKPALINEFPGMRVVSVGDPAGLQASQVDEQTCIAELGRLGIPTEPASTNGFIMRREAVNFFLNKMADGEPAFLLDPSCQVLRKGFQGGYKFDKVAVNKADERFKEVPNKNEFSHPHDALQYLCLKMRDPVIMESTRHGVGRHQENSWRGTTV